MATLENENYGFFLLRYLIKFCHILNQHKKKLVCVNIFQFWLPIRICTAALVINRSVNLQNVNIFITIITTTTKPDLFISPLICLESFVLMCTLNKLILIKSSSNGHMLQILSSNQIIWKRRVRNDGGGVGDMVAGGTVDA